ncbi:MAG: hypothetical protein AAF680_09930, partial [Pseudomonadota bacterium]
MKKLFLSGAGAVFLAATSGQAICGEYEPSSVRAKLADTLLLGTVSRSGFKWGEQQASSSQFIEYSAESTELPIIDNSRTTQAESISTDARAAFAQATYEDNSSIDQSAYKWGIRSDADQSAYKWGIRSDADQSAYKWGIRSDANQSAYKWGIRSDADQSAYKWGIRSDANQSAYKWG